LPSLYVDLRRLKGIFAGDNLDMYRFRPGLAVARRQAEDENQDQSYYSMHELIQRWNMAFSPWLLALNLYLVTQDNTAKRVLISTNPPIETCGRGEGA